MITPDAAMRLYLLVKADMTCRACGARVEFQRDVTVNEPYSDGYPLRYGPTLRRDRIAPIVVACSGCEMIEEVR